MTTATTVVHTVVTPAGRALAYAACSVRLVGPGFIGANQSEIMTSDTFTTSSTGQLSMALVPNVQIDTANTYYEVTLPDGEVQDFLVPVSGSPVSLESCLIQPPQPGPVVLPFVVSVNTHTGAVVLAASDVGAVASGAGVNALNSSTSVLASSSVSGDAQDRYQVTAAGAVSIGDGTVSRVDLACQTTSGSSTVVDDNIAPWDAGATVTGSGIPAGSFVGSGAHAPSPGAFGTFTLVDNTNTPVNATATNGNVNLTIGTPSLVRSLITGTIDPNTGLGTFLGRGAGFFSTNGSNVGVGYRALASATSAGGFGYWLTAIGSRALIANTSGYGNTAVGTDAGVQNTTGIQNTFLGVDAGQENVSGSFNTYAGFLSGQSGTANNGNSAFGAGAQQTGSPVNSCAFGFGALQAASGTNVGLGSSAGILLTSGSANTIVGTGGLGSCVTGGSNTAVGDHAGAATTVGNGVFVGANAGVSVNQNAGTYVGAFAGALPLGVAANASTSALRQTVVGFETGLSSTTQGADLTCIGYQATGTTGAVALGSGAKASGVNSVALGLGVQATAAGSVAIGRDSAGTAATSTVQDEIVIGTALSGTRLGNLGGTTATTGFPYMPATAGAPTGVPVTKAGYVPFQYDTTNHKLWVFDGGTWKGIVLA